MTYTERYPNGRRSNAMDRLIADMHEDPEFVAVDNDGNELFEFDGGEQVILTNAGVVTEDDDGFEELRDSIR